jgi:hypothetical protein
MQQSEEALKQVLFYARTHGQRPTRAQLRRYQQNGLIPKPRQVGLGRAKGTEVRYPSGTAEQLVAASKAMKSKSFGIARWRLWWDGWPIDPIRIKRDLRTHIRTSQQRESVPRWIRRRLNPVQTKRFRQISGQLIAGKVMEPISGDDERLLAKGMGVEQSLVLEMRRPGFWPVSGFGNIMQMVSVTMAAETVKLTLSNATEEELHATRDELRAVIANADGLTNLFESVGVPAFKRIASGLPKLSPSEQQSALVAWLSARQSPTVRNVYAVILQLCIQPSPINAKG